MNLNFIELNSFGNLDTNLDAAILIVTVTRHRSQFVVHSDFNFEGYSARASQLVQSLLFILFRVGFHELGFTRRSHIHSTFPRAGLEYFLLEEALREDTKVDGTAERPT